MQMDAAARDFSPFASLWRTAAALMEHERLWLEQPFKGLDADKMDTLAMEWFRKAFKLTKVSTTAVGEAFIGPGRGSPTAGFGWAIKPVQA
jgi:hypothetical protein